MDRTTALASLAVAAVLAACSFASLEGFSRVDDAAGDAGAGAQGDDAAAVPDGTTNDAGAATDASSLRAYRDEVLADGPLGYYRLDEASGPAVDLGPAKQNGTYGASVTRGIPGAIAGDPDTAIRSGGTGPAVVFGDVFGFPGTAPFSLEAWVLIRALDGTHRGICGKKQALPESGYSFWVHSTDGLGFGRYENGLLSEVKAPLPPAGYNHLVATFDGATMKLYVNGTLAGSIPSAVALVARTEGFAIGAKGSANGAFLDGDIDEVAIYDRALDGQRIAAHYAAGKR